MRTITQTFKNNISNLGRELDSKITYTLNNEVVELGSEELNSVNATYKGGLLKSVMKELEFDSNVDIPLETIVNYQFGVKVGTDEEDHNIYEYINYGNYVVYKSEKQEDTNSYLIKCYDKMLYSMKDYERPNNITYPITIRNYLIAICNELGLTFKDANTNFANYNRTIPYELYKDSSNNSLGYTYRDVLDELAQVTASTICINENDELEIRYVTPTSDTIDGEFLKDTNISFGEKYGPINSIVLSRSEDSDNVYLQDAESVEQNGLCELKIRDNQIMNFNDRSSYLPDILNKLDGLEYYINDIYTTGICYYELCDMYNVSIDNNNYQCVMLNDEVNVTKGLIENIYTEMPDTAETDYTKADKTDMRINKTYLIVDKQNQQIQSVVETTGQQNQKISQLTQTVNEINSKISDITEVTTSAEDTDAKVELDNINESEPIQVKIHPVVDNISYLYPNSSLYPSNNLYPKVRNIIFHNTTDDTYHTYPLPEDLLYYDETHYDEFLLDYGTGDPDTKALVVTKRCKYNADGTVGLLSTEEEHDYSSEYPYIVLTEGNYEVYVEGYSQAYIFVRMMVRNIYTSQYATKVELNSAISQTAEEIDLSVDRKLTDYSTTTEMNSAINVKANQITSSVSETYATKTTTNQLSSRISQTAKAISLSVNNGSTSSGITITTTKEDGTTNQATGTIQMNGLVSFTNLSTSGQTTINGANITTGTLSASKITSGTLDASKVSVTNLNANNITSGTIDASKVNVTKINASNITSGTISADKISGGTINASNISVTNILANNINRGSLTGANIDINNGTGFLKMLSGSAYNPYVSALNVSNKSNGISFRNSSSSGNAGSQIGTLHTEGTNLVMDATGNILIGGSSMSSGAVGIWSGYIHAGNMALGGNYLNADSGNINLNTESWSAVYANGTMIGGYSSKKAKDNIKVLDEKEIETLYNEVNNIPSCYYDYKEKFGGQKDNYGFIIEDFKEDGILRKVLHVINYKGIEKYSHDDLTQVNTILIKELMKKLETQQKEIEILKQEIKSIKESD